MRNSFWKEGMNIVFSVIRGKKIRLGKDIWLRVEVDSQANKGISCLVMTSNGVILLYIFSLGR